MTIRDGDWTLVDYDHATGRSVWSYFDGQNQHYRTDYPAQATLDENAIHRNAAQKAWTGDWHRVASIPLNVLYDSGLTEAMNQHDDKFVSRFLNDSDNRAWRTKDGRV